MTDILRRIGPLMSAYHYLMALLGALFYGFPGRRLTVIGVTGTKGKTTTSHLIAHVLNASGVKTGLATTVHFGIAGRFWKNDTKQTMLGRFALQKLLRRMVDEGCTHAVIETSSEGIAQHRHRFIGYRMAVFTNLSPEHIERHGSLENYIRAKMRLFSAVARRKDGVGVYNLDDGRVGFFLRPPVPRKVGYMIATSDELLREVASAVVATEVDLRTDGTAFSALGERFETPLVGEFNVSNALAAIAAARELGVPLPAVRDALRSVPPVPGRVERVEQGQKFTVIVDYAHEPSSLEAIYRAARLWNPKRMIGLLGAQGGGRDHWKREAMGRVAGRHLDVVILANEDPYDEDPMKIMDDIEKGVGREVGESAKRPAVAPRFARAMAGRQATGELQLYKIVDRREAIRKAFSLAGPGDVVLLTGKGGEVWMCVEKGKKIPWDERKVAEEELEKLAER